MSNSPRVLENTHLLLSQTMQNKSSCYPRMAGPRFKDVRGKEVEGDILHASSKLLSGESEQQTEKPEGRLL